MFLHILPRVRHSQIFIEFVAKNFDLGEHKFILLGYREGKESFDIFFDRSIQLTQYNRNITTIENYRILELRADVCDHFDKVFVHGLYDLNLFNFFQIQQDRLNFSKIYFSFWGGDIEKGLIPVGLHIKDRCQPQKFFATKIQHIVSGPVLYQHFLKAIQPFETSKIPKLHFCFNPSNIVEISDDIKMSTVPKSRPYLLVGHSANTEARHEEILMQLHSKLRGDYKIFCPLAYGDESYKDTIVALGKSLFDKNFVALTRGIPYESYQILLNNIDVFLFNHKNHQAVSNIVLTLGLGKKIYLRNDCPGWKFFTKNFGFEIYATDNFLQPSPRSIDLSELVYMDADLRKRNMTLIDKYFSRSAIIQQWYNVFYST